MMHHYMDYKKKLFLDDNFALYVLSSLQSSVPKCSFPTEWGKGWDITSIEVPKQRYLN